jgi:hypothetical protein
MIEELQKEAERLKTELSKKRQEYRDRNLEFLSQNVPPLENLKLTLSHRLKGLLQDLWVFYITFFGFLEFCYQVIFLRFTQWPGVILIAYFALLPRMGKSLFGTLKKVECPLYNIVIPISCRFCYKTIIFY